MKIYWSVIRPIVVYDCEIWVLNPSNDELNPICPLLALFGDNPIIHARRLRVKQSITQKLFVFERKILRKIFEQTKEAIVIWRIKANRELDEIIKHRNVTNCVKAQRLSWFGHINRTAETSIVKRIHKWKPFKGRPAGRSKSKWDDDVRNDLKKMKLVKWAKQVQDRLRWKAIVEKAKNLTEL